MITGGVASGRVYPAACAAGLFQIRNPFKLKQQKGFGHTLFDVNSLYIATLCLSKDVKLEKAFIKGVCIRKVGYHKGKTIMFIVSTDYWFNKIRQSSRYIERKILTENICPCQACTKFCVWTTGGLSEQAIAAIDFSTEFCYINVLKIRTIGIDLGSPKNL